AEGVCPLDIRHATAPGSAARAVCLPPRSDGPPGRSQYLAGLVRQPVVAKARDGFVGEPRLERHDRVVSAVEKEVPEGAPVAIQAVAAQQLDPGGGRERAAGEATRLRAPRIEARPFMRPARQQ